MVDKFGWNGAIVFWVLSALICIAICSVLMIDERKKKHL